MPESSETENLTAQYLSEDPIILTEADLQRIADVYGLTLARVKTLANDMTRLRKEVDTENDTAE